jgi:hypothetical protein
MARTNWLRVGIAGGMVASGGYALWRELRRAKERAVTGEQSKGIIRPHAVAEDRAAGPPARYTQHRSLPSLALSAAFSLVNHFVPWHRLPPWLGILNLLAFRDVLRQHNLHDTSHLPSIGGPTVEPKGPYVQHMRTIDGSYNDLDWPAMGMTGARFGRNFPLDQVYPEPEPGLLCPSPREISRKLMTRQTFVPARSLNVLAAAWIQFQTHDWFNHGGDPPQDDFALPLEKGDPWPHDMMVIPRTPLDPTRPADDTSGPPTYVNRISHWWDASAIYGSDEKTSDRLREKIDGKLKVKDRSLPTDPQTGMTITGFNDNWWIGLAILHTLFALEHNAICERLKLEYPYWTDEQLFCKARLINAALIAKIHTVEWTPAIVAHPALKIGMNTNWWGLVGERLTKLLGRFSKSEVLSGIPGSGVDHHTAPFALTEEFTSVYRLHPLIPDDLEFRSLNEGRVLKRLPLVEVLREKANTVIDDQVSIQDVFFSFGMSHPGAVTLHNFPRFMQELEVDDIHGNKRLIDLAAVDIMRDRERGVPRYNRFRRLIHMPPVRSFEELTSNKVWARELREVYHDDIERVDLMVGMYAEPLPEGFGFSDTAFRIFILMASRRLKSDRFFAADFTPEVYTPIGIQWVNDNDMRSVLIRHYPELTPVLRNATNAFAPWPRLH